MRKYFLLSFLVCAANYSVLNGCSIFLANDGKNIWIGNNEDDDPNKVYNLYFRPATKKHQFGYITWGGKLSGLSSFVSEDFPEGGINEKGLFIDAASLPEKIAIVKDESKDDWKGYVINDILKKCNDVEEALVCLSLYNLIEQEKAQLFLADALGNYAIVHANYVIRKSSQNFSLTNYCLNNTFSCWRRNIIDDYLSHHTEYGLNEISDILEKSAQKDYYNKTNYSIAGNLLTKQLHFYLQGDFNASVSLDVVNELKKGKRDVKLRSLFLNTFDEQFIKSYKKKGMVEALKTVDKKEIIVTSHATFLKNFSLDLASQGKMEDAKLILDRLEIVHKSKSQINLWKAIILKKIKQEENSSIDTTDQSYLYKLFLQQKNGEVTFALDYFEKAQTVALAGDFTNWKDHAVPLSFKDGKWQATIKIPSGDHQYKFIVDGVWVTDPYNRLTAQKENNVNSLLYVW